ncbi:MAG: hypothetical protein ABI333_15890, partial [bacterium]
LAEQITRHASFMSVNFKKRQVKMFFWGKTVKGTCPAGQGLEEKFKSCLNDPPKLPGQKEVEDANWNCFWWGRKYWLPEFYYAIGYHREGDYKRLVQPFCQKTDLWWNRTRPRLEKQAKAGGPKAPATLKLYACSAAATAAQLAKGETLRCGVWSHCNAQNNFLCLSPYWEVRLRFYRHAALLAPALYLDGLLRISSQDLMAPHGLKAKWLPKKDKSAFYDSDDKLYVSSLPWPAEVEQQRLKKAREVLEQELCEARKGLWVVKECGSELECYLTVLKGVRKVPTESCDKLGAPPTQKLESRPTPSKRAVADWRAKRKALRMIAMLGADREPFAPQRKKVIKTAVEIYAGSGALPAEPMRELRKMALLVIDRLGDYAKQKDVTCTARLLGQAPQGQQPAPDLALYRHKLRIARAHGDKLSIARYERLLGPAAQQAAKAATPQAVTRSCFSLLRDVVREETQRRLQGAWQINREARSALGRLARRAGARYGDL